MREVIYVTSNADVIRKVLTKKQRITPDRLMPNRPKGTKFIIRQKPIGAAPMGIEGIWEVYDARTSKINPTSGQFYSRPDMVASTPEKDAAIGYALIMP
jgi:hypothetical protein